MIQRPEDTCSIADAVAACCARVHGITGMPPQGRACCSQDCSTSRGSNKDQEGRQEGLQLETGSLGACGTGSRSRACRPQAHAAHGRPRYCWKQQRGRSRHGAQQGRCAGRHRQQCRAGKAHPEEALHVFRILYRAPGQTLRRTFSAGGAFCQAHLGGGQEGGGQAAQGIGGFLEVLPPCCDMAGLGARTDRHA